MKIRHKKSYVRKAEFLIRLGTLLEQGYPIADAFELFLKYEKETNDQALRIMLEKFRKGSSVSEALSVLQLPKNIINFVYFSEYYGDLARGLIDGGQLLRKTQETKAKFQKLIKYPLLLFWILGLFLIIMYRNVFPQFTQLFSTINVELPLVTRMLLAFIEYSPLVIPLFLGSSLFLYVYYYYLFRKKDPLQKAKFYSKVPVAGTYYKVMLTYFFAANLSCLIKSGLAIYDSLAIFKNMEGLGYISKEAEQMIAHLESGEKLDQVIINNTLYLQGLAYIVEHGQANGRLDDELSYYSEWLLLDLEEKLKKLFMIIQPILF
ncbi:type II secretion system F family protein [Anaerobacillus sp. CMMVII]|uniref:competence type IV pilus assembly protein ComGB n=1 Tax=Anaerobacillus sp. CMMVII TaxID=2755588 RepID=UPI0021B81A8D|nr:competence type IV pilus assembly protein ComGB [Anaerobacillus sp. CMMVII]MCT8138588.1 type II secretion system F family protein [Anaerobacillus sp. CMMVII]